jgi:HEAT repeat protein
VVLGSAASARAQPARQKVEQTLDDMAARGSQFPPERLMALGPEGFAAVFDWLLPETADAKPAEVPDDVARELIARLGDENYQVREAATRQLHQLGPGAQAAVLRAAASQDADVSWRAVRVLRSWEDARNQDVGRYVPAMSACLAQLRDPQRLTEIARRVQRTLELSPPRGHSRDQIVRACIAALTRADDDRFLDPLRPLLDHQNARVGLLIVQAMSMALREQTSGTCPKLLLAALESPRSEIVQAAVDALPNCAKSPHAAEVRRRLTAAFEGPNERLKMRACRALLCIFDDPAALEHLLEQAGQTQDRQRQYEAIGILADPRNRGKPAGPKLVKTLTDLIGRNDLGHMRVTLTTALGNYKGDDVLRALAGLLADNYQPVRDAAANRLREHDDRPAVLRALDATIQASKDGKNQALERQAEQLLGELKQPSDSDER